MATNFNLTLSSNNSSNSFFNTDSNFGLDISDNTIETASSILTNSDKDSGFDAFGGKDLFGEPDFSNMDANLFANADGTETAGSVASAETIGSVAFASTETAGSVACSDGGAASASGSEGGSFSSFC